MRFIQNILLIAACAGILWSAKTYVTLSKQENNKIFDIIEDTDSTTYKVQFIESLSEVQGHYTEGIPNVPFKYIIHSTANERPWADAQFHDHYLDTTSRKVSWHITVDDKMAIQSMDFRKIAWHAGHCNPNTIAIEVCQYKGMDQRKTLENLTEVIDKLEELYPGIKAGTHYECTGKNCPSWLPLKYFFPEARHYNVYDFDKVEAYIDLYKVEAQIQEDKYGIPAAITLAQALLESNVGESMLATKANNHFGIKCFSTKCRKGHCINKNDDSHKDFFRTYSNVIDSYEDHSEILLKKRYSVLFALDKNNLKGWAYGLKKCGYATSPTYPEKILGLIYRYNLHKL